MITPMSTARCNIDTPQICLPPVGDTYSTFQEISVSLFHIKYLIEAKHSQRNYFG